MRNVFVLNLNPISVSRFKFNQSPVPICAERSMIDRRVRGAYATTVYPTNPMEIDYFNTYLHMYQRYNRLLAFFLRDPKGFQPLNFFEYVLKCRYEYYMSELLS